MAMGVKMAMVRRARVVRDCIFGQEWTEIDRSCVVRNERVAV